MCQRVIYKKIWIFFASITSLKKGIESGVGSKSVSQRYGSPNPDPHQSVTDPVHCFVGTRSASPVLQIVTVFFFFLPAGLKRKEEKKNEPGQGKEESEEKVSSRKERKEKRQIKGERKVKGNKKN
jgi:hypothetical protein